SAESRGCLGRAWDPLSARGPPRRDRGDDCSLAGASAIVGRMTLPPAGGAAIAAGQRRLNSPSGAMVPPQSRRTPAQRVTGDRIPRCSPLFPRVSSPGPLFAMSCAMRIRTQVGVMRAALLGSMGLMSACAGKAISAAERNADGGGLTEAQTPDAGGLTE